MLDTGYSRYLIGRIRRSYSFDLSHLLFRARLRVEVESLDPGILAFLNDHLFCIFGSCGAVGIGSGFNNALRLELCDSSLGRHCE